jgi:hypothetical protein
MLVKKTCRGLIFAAALALVVLANASAALQPQHQQAKPVTVPGPAHWSGPHGTSGNWGHVPARPRSKSHAGRPEVDNLTNPGNNEIMPGTTDTYVIFWLPSGYHFSGGTTAASDTSYENTILKYYNDVSGSQILNTTTQYCGNNGCPGDTSNFVASMVDTTTFPKAGTTGDPLRRSDLASEIASQIGSHSWPLDSLSVMYFILLPDNVVDCGSGSSTDCNTNKYCAYHTWDTTSGHRFVWADIPDNRSIYTIGGCGNSNVTGDNSADTTLSSTEHEHMEAITDPLLNAWMDSTGDENGDKCNRNMGVANASSTTADNFLGAGNADLFRIQREWSNAAGGGGCAASYTTSGSHVESPVPSGGDVTNTVTEPTIAGNNGDSLHYHLSFHDPSHQDDAFSISVADTLPAGISGSPPSALGDLAPHQTVTRNFTGTLTGGPLLDGTVLTASAVYSFNDSTGAAQPTITRTATTTVVNTAPTVVVPGPQSQDYHDALTFGVSASDPDAGDSISLAASGLPAGLTFTDNGNRTGTVSGTITAAPGNYTATFTADDHHHLSASSATLQITVTREETTTTYTGPTVVAQGFPVTLTAQLLEDGTTAPSPSGQSLTLTIGAQSCLATADALGNAQCTIPSVTAPLGTSVPVTASFGGDTYYLASSDTSHTATVFAFPSRGAFVLGDLTVAGAGPFTTLTWWSSQWSMLNNLSGGRAPSAFKGFAASLSPPSPPACGGTWLTKPGNSPPPVADVPSLMGVLVSSTITSSGSTISGDTPKIVVVRTDPGYGMSPGHDGTGTLVATYCG